MKSNRYQSMPGHHLRWRRWQPWFQADFFSIKVTWIASFMLSSLLSQVDLYTNILYYISKIRHGIKTRKYPLSCHSEKSTFPPLLTPEPGTLLTPEQEAFKLLLLNAYAYHYASHLNISNFLIPEEEKILCFIFVMYFGKINNFATVYPYRERHFLFVSRTHEYESG